MKKKILIAEESPTDRKILVDMLSKNYYVIEADGSTALLDFINKNFQTLSAILIDFSLLTSNTFNLVNEIRKNMLLAQIPFMVIAVKGDPAEKKIAYGCGANGFIEKPYEKEWISDIVKNCISLRETSLMASCIQHDSLTHLYMRNSFFREAEKMIKEKPAGYYILAAFNVENFKVINDQYGTVKGDSVLKHIGRELDEGISALGGICGRFSADKFAILYPTAYNDSEMISEIKNRASTPREINYALKIRVGRYLINDLSLRVSAMYDRAIMAENSIKGIYDRTIANYDDVMRDKILLEQDIVMEMNGALERGEFEPWFQPQFNHATGKLIGAEALVRWNHPIKGWISPGVFVPIFEKNGFIYQLDKYIWERVCIILRDWIDRGKKPVPVSVNISRKDVYQKDFLEYICGLIGKYHIPIELFRLEITESAFLESAEHLVASIHKLIEFGFIVEIDDFGSGYSSLNTLKDVPVQILKLDMHFMEKGLDSERGGSILESVVRMAKWLDMEVIAEGVENKEQADYLLSVGCFYIQGYYYSMPLPLSEYEALDEKWEKQSESKSLETIDAYNNNKFWNPESIETMVFNHYSGGAFIFEYHKGNFEILRINNEFTKTFCSKMSAAEIMKITPFSNLEPISKKQFYTTLRRTFRSRKAETCEIYSTVYSATKKGEFIQLTIRMIARTKDRYLFYAYVHNTTARHVAEARALEMAKKLEIIVNNIGGAVVAMTVEEPSKILMANDRFYNMFGCTRQDATNKRINPFDRIVPEDVQNYKSNLKIARRKQVPVSLIYRIRVEDCIFWLQERITYITLPNVESIVELSVIGDITDLIEAQQREQEAKRKQEEIALQMQGIVENVHGGVLAVRFDESENLEVIFANDKFFEMYGYNKSEVSEKNLSISSMILAEDLPYVRSLVKEKLLKKGEPIICEYRCFKKDNSVITVRCSASLTDTKASDNRMIVAVINDITDIKKAEKEAAEFSERLNIITANVGCGITAIAIKEGKRKFIFANDKFYELMGYSKKEYNEHVANHYSLMNAEDRKKIDQEISEKLNFDHSLRVEYRIHRGDGKELWMRSILTLTRFIGIDSPVELSTYSDISVEKETDEQLLFLNHVSNKLLEQSDPHIGIQECLKYILAIFQAKRAYLLEFFDYGQYAMMNYELCAEGVVSVQNNLKHICMHKMPYWKNVFDTKKYVSLSYESLDKGEDLQNKEFLGHKIDKVFAVPLVRDGTYFGMMVLEDSTIKDSEAGRMLVLANYISMALTRRDLSIKLRKETQSITAIMNGIPGGFMRMQLLPDGKIIPLYFSDGFKNLTEMEEDELVEVYGSDGFGGVHPEDREIVQRAITEMREGKEEQNITYRLLNGKHGYTLVMAFGKMRKTETGEIFLNFYYADATKSRKA